MDVTEVKREIRRLEANPPTWETCSKLSILYTVLDHNLPGDPLEVKQYPRISREAAEAWVASMFGETSSGEQWSFEQAAQVMRQREIVCDPVEFYVTLNMMHSDFSRVAKRLSLNSMDFYARLAEAFLNDPDAPPDKLARYYSAVTK